MKAAQARSKAVSIAQKEAAEKSAALQKRRAALKESVPRLRAERIKQIEAKFRERIEYAVEDGKNRQRSPCPLTATTACVGSTSTFP